MRSEAVCADVGDGLNVRAQGRIGDVVTENVWDYAPALYKPLSRRFHISETFVYNTPQRIMIIPAAYAFGRAKAHMRAASSQIITV